jgi:hypothetical protein
MELVPRHISLFCDDSFSLNGIIVSAQHGKSVLTGGNTTMLTKTKLALLTAAIILGAASAAQAAGKDDADAGTHSHVFGSPAHHVGKYHSEDAPKMHKHIKHHASHHEDKKTDSAPK